MNNCYLSFEEQTMELYIPIIYKEQIEKIQAREQGRMRLLLKYVDVEGIEIKKKINEYKEKIKKLEEIGQIN